MEILSGFIWIFLLFAGFGLFLYLRHRREMKNKKRFPAKVYTNYSGGGGSRRITISVVFDAGASRDFSYFATKTGIRIAWSEAYRWVDETRSEMIRAAKKGPRKDFEGDI